MVAINKRTKLNASICFLRSGYSLAIQAVNHGWQDLSSSFLVIVEGLTFCRATLKIPVLRRIFSCPSTCDDDVWVLGDLPDISLVSNSGIYIDQCFWRIQ